jgi:hypothetical protein
MRAKKKSSSLPYDPSKSSSNTSQQAPSNECSFQADQDADQYMAAVENARLSAGEDLSHCRYHSRVTIAAQNNYTSELGGLERFLKEDVSEQYAILSVVGGSGLSISKNCTCKGKFN